MSVYIHGQALFKLSHTTSFLPGCTSDMSTNHWLNDFGINPILPQRQCTESMPFQCISMNRLSPPPPHFCHIFADIF